VIYGYDRREKHTHAHGQARSTGPDRMETGPDSRTVEKGDLHAQREPHGRKTVTTDSTDFRERLPM